MQMSMICSDLKNQISRPPKIAIDGNVSVTDNVQTSTVHPLHLHITFIFKLYFIHFQQDFSYVLPKNG